MEKIVFYEDRDFQGKSYDCKGDSADLQGFIRRCNSVKVEGGWWVLYERNNYMGYQYVIGPGQYNDYRRWMGFNDCVRSCRIIKNAKGPPKLRLFDRPNFDGNTLELTENTKSIQEKWFRREVQSCKVLEGSWVFFEHPNFCGRQYLLEKGEYRHHSAWGALKSTLGSIRMIIEIVFYEDKNFQGRSYESTSDCSELNAHISRCNSVRVESAAWALYERPNYLGCQYVLTRGEYPDYQHWMGGNDSIRSCRIVRNTSGGAFRVRVYEHPDFGGQMLECSEDLENLPERWRLRDAHSAQVQDGAWVFYEHPDYRGRQYLLERGAYRRFTEWAAMNPNVGSLRRVHDV